MLRAIQTLMVSAAIIVMLIVLVGATRPAAQSDSASVEALTQRIDELTDRVELLEYVAGVELERLGVDIDKLIAEGEFDVPSSSSELMGGRFLEVDTIESVEVEIDHSKAIAGLRSDVQSLQGTVQSEERMLSGIERQASNRGRGAQTQEENRSRRLRSQQKLIRNYKRQLSKKEAELQRLESETNSVRQVVRGHAGDRLITLRTEVDLSSELSEVSQGGLITWSGRREEMSEDAETWVVRRIKPVKE